MDISRFEAAKNKARQMIHNDALQDSHIIKERQLDRERTYKSLKGDGAPAFTGYDNIAPSYGSNGTSISSLNEQYSDTNEKLYNAMDNRMQQFMESRQQMQTPMKQAPRQINKNLPKEILESFSNNYIDTSAMDIDRPVLDRIGITNGNEQIAENYSQTQQNVGKIDYELIKNIIESSVKKYVTALGKKMLNENTNNDLGMIQIGEKKINLVTKNGDIYEANLKFVKNIKKG